MGWDRLVVLAAAVAAALLLATGLAKGDTESLVLGAGFAIVAVIALAVSRVRTLVHVALGLLFVNVLFWMATAAVANVSSPEDVAAVDVFVPVALSVSSSVGVIAIIAARIDRRRPVRGVRALGLAAVALIAIALVYSQAGGISDDEVAAPGSVVVDTEDAVFEPERLELAAGAITVVTRNRDLFWHTFTIDELGVDIRVPVGARRRATFTVQPGTYDYYCAIPGHRSIGMEGVLVVR